MCVGVKEKPMKAGFKIKGNFDVGKNLDEFGSNICLSSGSSITAHYFLFSSYYYTAGKCKQKYDLIIVQFFFSIILIACKTV